MEYTSRIVFPMRIEASDLFDVIHRQAHRWRMQLDNTDKNRAVFQVAKKLPSTLHPRPSTETSGQRINVMA